jgi:RNA recognition motif-containing protein
MTDEATGLCRGVGFVNYCDADGAARAARAMNDVLVGDRRLRVSVQAPRGPAHGHGAGPPPLPPR